MDVTRLGPSHCTGDRAIERMRAAYKDDFVAMGVGTRISLEDWQEAGRGIKIHVEVLYEVFKQAVKDRLDAFEKPMLSISGGLDSRIIMGEIDRSENGWVFWDNPTGY